MHVLVSMSQVLLKPLYQFILVMASVFVLQKKGSTQLQKFQLDIQHCFSLTSVVIIRYPDQKHPSGGKGLQFQDFLLI